MIEGEHIARQFVAYLARVRGVDRFALGRRLLAMIALGCLRSRPEDDAVWQALRLQAHHPGHDLQRSITTLAASVERSYPILKGVFSRVLVTELNQSPNLAEIVQVGWLFAHELELLPSDAFGEWLNSRLEDSATFGPVVSDLATSARLSDLLVGLAQVRSGGTIYDPCCGLGNVLAAAWRAAGSTAELYGVEIHPTSWAFSRLRMALLGAPAHIELADALRAPPRRPGGFDHVICEPPTGGLNALRPQDMPSNQGLGVRPSRLESAFIEHCAEVISPRGRAAILIGQTVLSRKGYEERLRRRLLLTGQLRAIISLPASVGAWASADLAIIVLQARSVHPGSVRMVDGHRALGRERRGPLSLAEIERITDLACGPVVAGASADVALTELAESDRFRPGAYFSAKAERVDIHEVLRRADEHDRQARVIAEHIRDLSAALQIYRSSRDA